MKTRIGFVSNSSSTSFCIYGTIVDKKDIQKLSNELNTNNKIYTVADALNLDYHNEYQDSDTYVLGKSLSNIKDNETMNEFKNKIEQIILKYLSDAKFNIHEGGWFDG